MMELEEDDWAAWLILQPHWIALDAEKRRAIWGQLPEGLSGFVRAATYRYRTATSLTKSLQSALSGWLGTAPSHAVPAGLYLARRIEALGDPLRDNAALQQWIFSVVETNNMPWFHTGLGRPFSPATVDTTAARSADRLERFLKIPPGEAGSQWMKEERLRYCPQTVLRSHLYSGYSAVLLGQAMIRRLQAAGGTAPLADLLKENPPGLGKPDRNTYPRAVHSLVQTGLVALRWNVERMDLDACLPATAAGLTLRPATAAHTQVPAPPPEADPVTLLAPPLVADAALLLSSLAARPLRVSRSNASLYVKDSKELATRAAVWPEKVLDNMYGLPGRFDVSVTALKALRLVQLDVWPERILQINPEGRKWLALSPTARLQLIMDKLITGKDCDWGYKLHYGFYPAPGARHLDLTKSTMASLRHLPDDQFVCMKAWLRWAVVAHNPIAPMVDEFFYTSSAAGWKRHLPAEALADAELELGAFLTARLIPLGCVDAGLSPDGRLLIRLSPAGKYYLGMEKTFTLPDAAPPGRVVVQPNFEIVFLGENLAADGALACLCERLPGSGSGVRYRITKASCLQAAHEGWTADRAVKTLTETTGQPLPKNVSAELAGWFAARRTYGLAQATLVDLPDAATALAFLSALGPRATRLNDTTLRLQGKPALSAAERKKLEKAGLFPATGEKGKETAEADDDFYGGMSMETLIHGLLGRASRTRPKPRRRRGW